MGAGYTIPVRLRYRVAEGKVTWTVSMHRADQAFADAVQESADVAKTKTDLPLFFGAPEA